MLVSLTDAHTLSMARYRDGVWQFRVGWLRDLRMQCFASNDVDKYLLICFFFIFCVCA